ncbi:MAG: NADAR family protein [Ekhidna sp.]
MTISFLNKEDVLYGCFSNFSDHGFDLEGAWWPTTEHYFQAQKFAGTEHVEVIRQAPNPTEATKLGRDRNRPLRSDWEAVKDAIMQRGTLAKFQTHEDIRKILLDTGDAPIVEISPNEEYWGLGKDGNGKNRMGTILMSVRDELRRENS